MKMFNLIFALILAGLSVAYGLKGIYMRLEGEPHVGYMLLALLFYIASRVTKLEGFGDE